MRVPLGDWSPVVRDPIDVLRATFLAGAVVAAAAGDIGNAVRLFLTFLITVAARWVNLPRPFDFAFVLGMGFQAWGNALGVFESWAAYDKLVHFILPATVAPLLYIVLARLQAVPDLTQRFERRRGAGILIVSFALGFSVGTMYEIYEYIVVHELSANLEIGYADTIGDLADDAIGSLLGGVLLVLWAYRGWSTIRRVPPDRIDGPRDRE